MNFSAIFLICAFVWFQNNSVHTAVTRAAVKRQINNLDYMKFFDFYVTVREDSPELIARHDGFDATAHEIVTTDGWRIKMARITRLEGKDPSKEPILLLYGILTSASEFLVLSPENCLAYNLARMGHEVWLLNYRGQYYEDLPDYGMDELGKYDIPEQMDYILKETRARQVSIVTCSLGSANLYIALAVRPDLNSRLRKIVNMGQANIFSVTPGVWAYYHTLKAIYTGKELVGDLLTRVCFKNESMSSNREASFTQVYEDIGCAVSYENKTIMYKEMAAWKARGCQKMDDHWIQQGLLGKLSRFDYGATKNVLIYNQTCPPLYTLAGVTAHVMVFYGKGDPLILPEYSRRFCTQFPRRARVICREVADPKFTHGDFIYNDNAKRLVYDHVINFLSSK